MAKSKKEMSPVEAREARGEIVFDKEELTEFLRRHDRRKGIKPRKPAPA